MDREIKAWERINHLLDCVHNGTVAITTDTDIFCADEHVYSLSVILATILDYACQGLDLPYPSATRKKEVLIHGIG